MTAWCVFKMVGIVLVFSYLMIGIICAVVLAIIRKFDFLYLVQTIFLWLPQAINGDWD